jgi:hypothetical protein
MDRGVACGSPVDFLAELAGCAPLSAAQVESRVEGLPPDLWDCRHLTRLELDLKGSAALPPPSGPPGAPCLPALLELRLARCLLPGGVLPPAVCRPPALRRLEVVRCGLTGGCAHAALPPQFTALTSLVSMAGRPSRAVKSSRPAVPRGAGRCRVVATASAPPLCTLHPCVCRST